MAQSIMVQGTMSNVGKSLLVAGLCRIFRQDGFRVAPFKSQNMALNSYVTKEGLEMGRAQVMQAEAAGIEPRVAMNPVLLKPHSEKGSQVIVNGEVWGNMDAAAYFRCKRRLRPVIRAAYDDLAAEQDIVVLEGAGSPAEINLRAQDIVNMGMAEMARAPVLLAGDIDRGGVFAQLYGTMQLLTPDERRRVKGLVINKFRGDPALLRDGLGQLEALCGVPVVGVVPYMKLDLDDEDSLSSRLEEKGAGGVLDVAVLRLPRLSNFTDFNVLGRHPGMNLRYVERAERIGRPDLLLLPGSKNTMADMRWMEETGAADCVRALAAGGTPTIGICGGYQLLGESLSDPDGVEEGGAMKGLGLLPVRTVFSAAKSRHRAQGSLSVAEGFFAPLAGMRLEGYEIHMGRTAGDVSHACLLRDERGERRDGAVRGNVLGTYLHGFFDAPGVVDALASLLVGARGLPKLAERGMDGAAYKQEQYDALASQLRAALDMDAIRRIAREGV